MNRRRAVRLVVSLALAAAFAGACSRSEQESRPGAARSLSAIWTDVLAQRDAIQTLMNKPLEDVTHEDCSALGDAARKLDGYMNELRGAVAAKSEKDEGRLRAIGDVILRMQSTTSQIRESALAEAPGAWAQLRYPFDQTVRSVETYFSADELGGQSVLTRPNFETKPIPPPPSPI